MEGGWLTPACPVWILCWAVQVSKNDFTSSSGSTNYIMTTPAEFFPPKKWEMSLVPVNGLENWRILGQIVMSLSHLDASEVNQTGNV